MRHEWEEKQKKANVSLSKSPKQGILAKIIVSRSQPDYKKPKSVAGTAREEGEYLKWLKQKENIG